MPASKSNDSGKVASYGCDYVVNPKRTTRFDRQCQREAKGYITDTKIFPVWRCTKHKPRKEVNWWDGSEKRAT